MKAALLSFFLIFVDLNAHAGSATWNLNPESADWNSATNWTPNTIPNAVSDVATFGVSNVAGISVSRKFGINVSEIEFTPGASAFTITVEGTQSSLEFAGAGITNNSGITQNFITLPDTRTSINNEINFTGASTAGDGIVFTNNGGPNNGGHVYFYETSNAGSASFINHIGGVPGGVGFFDNSSAANATFLNESGLAASAGTAFSDNASAGNATFTVEGGLSFYFNHASVAFLDSSTAANATITLLQGQSNGGGGVLTI